jgi:P4 family phage/plasmid primase-like protien
MTIAQLNSNDMPTPEDHFAQGEKILATALEMAGKGFPVFPVHGLRWHRSVVPVGLATAVPGGDLRNENGNDDDDGEGKEGKEEELEVAQRIELRCTCGVVSCANIGKHPVGGLVPHGSKDATTDQLQLRAWFAVPALEVVRERGWVPWNLALATGAGLVVVDAEARQINASLPTGLDVLDDWENWTRGTSLPPAVGVVNSVIVIAEDGTIGVSSTGDLVPALHGEDVDEGGLRREGYWPGTLRVRTGSGGLHVYVRVSPDLRIKSRNRVLPAVDIKGDGGYVLVPPSRHASGGVYSVQEGRWTGIAQAAEDLVGWLLTVKGGRYATRRLQDTGAGASEPTDYDFHRIVAGNGCPAGFRDYFINDLCFRLRRAGTRLEEASAALRKEWARMEQPKDEFYDWSTCLYKLRRVWEEVTPEDVTDLPAWRPPGQGEVPQVKSLPTVAAAASGSGEVFVVRATGVPGGDLVEVREDGGVDIGPGSTWQLLGRRDLTMQLSDTGNAKRYAQRMREMVRYCADEEKWYVWDGSRWAVDTLERAMYYTEEIIKDLYVEAQGPSLTEAEVTSVLRWAEQTEGRSRRESMLRLAQVEPAIALAAKQMDVDPWQLVVQNGTLDLKSGVLRESRAEDLNTRLAAVTFDPEAQCPDWLKHIEFVTGGDPVLARYLQRAVGYSLTGSNVEQKVLFLWGDGANGKNTLMDVIASLMGDYAMAADENFLSGDHHEHPTQLAALRGKRLVYADETDENRKIKESRIKHLTGSKTIRARFMRKDSFEFPAQFKIWIMGNHKPQIMGNDQGIWRRLKLVPFTHVLSDDQKILGYDEILMREMSGILNWALAGLRDWHQLGGLGEAEQVTKATKEYREEEDLIGQVLRTLIVETGNAEDYFAGPEFYQLYTNWMNENGQKVNIKAANVIGRDLTKRGLVSEQKWVTGTGNIRIWRGARLRQVHDGAPR